MTSVLAVASEASNVSVLGTRFSAGRLHDFATLQAGGQLHSQDAAGEHAKA